MKRPKQHKIETISKKVFESIIPDEWVFRELNPDYGIDYLIEIFENNESTGRIFYVQLKGSEQEITKSTFKIQFKIDTLKYYSTLPIPVLLVCVSTTEKLVWASWVNNYLESKQILFEQKEGDHKSKRKKSNRFN